MKYPQLLLVYWWCVHLSVHLSAGADYAGVPVVIDGRSCVTDYWYTVTCVLNITGDPVGRYRLEFDWEMGSFTCPLVVLDHSYGCTVAARSVPAESTESFSALDYFSIYLYSESGVRTVLIKDFDPSENIQLMASYDVVVQRTSEVFNITWKSGYERHPYLHTNIEYELLLQSSNKVSRLSTYTTSLSLGVSQLELDTTYGIKVRSRPSIHYDGIWSKWSPLTNCTIKSTESSKEQESLIPLLVKCVGPICAAAGVLLFVFYNPATRMKIRTLSHIPSPAPFFQPLFQEYKGNLQEWLSSQGDAILTYKTEELLTTDALIIVPTPITNDREHRFPRDAPLTPPTSTQCHPSYVTLPGMKSTSLPFPSPSGNQGDTFYAPPLLCSAPDFGFGEVAVVTSLPEDFVDISREDSSSRCEDPSQSSPNSPLQTQPQCFCDDYCILNKTAEGVIPILLQKGSILNVPSESLRMNDV